MVLKFLPVGQKENNWTTTTKADASSALLHALMVFFWAAGSNFCWARPRGRCGSSHPDRYGPAITSHRSPITDHRWTNLVDGNGPSPAIPLTGQSSNESNLNLLSSTVACFDIPNWTLWSILKHPDFVLQIKLKYTSVLGISMIKI